jgi:hypothetical protein
MIFDSQTDKMEKCNICYRAFLTVYNSLLTYNAISDIRYFILIYIVLNIFMKKAVGPAGSALSSKSAPKTPKFDTKQYEKPGLSAEDIIEIK